MCSCSQKAVTGVGFTADSAIAYTASLDGTIKTWNINGECVGDSQIQFLLERSLLRVGAVRFQVEESPKLLQSFNYGQPIHRMTLAPNKQVWHGFLVQCAQQVLMVCHVCAGCMRPTR
jgi:WD40 repeat protein